MTHPNSFARIPDTGFVTCERARPSRIPVPPERHGSGIYSSHKAVVRTGRNPAFKLKGKAALSALREFWLGIDPPRPNRVQRKVSLSNSRVSVSRSDLGLFCAPRVLADLASDSSDCFEITLSHEVHSHGESVCDSASIQFDPAQRLCVS